MTMKVVRADINPVSYQEGPWEYQFKAEVQFDGSEKCHTVSYCFTTPSKLDKDAIDDSLFRDLLSKAIYHSLVN